MKMKRISAAMLATVMALSLAACGAPAESTGAGSEGAGDVQISTERTDEQADPAESATTPAVTETTEQTTTATTAPAEPEAPVELPVLNVEPALVMNGCMAFKADGKNYVYDITENEMYETEYDVDDITVLKGCVAVVGDVSSLGLGDSDAQVVNLKTGEQYADVRPFFSYDYTGSYLTVGKLDKSFSGNTVSIGMLNNNGEWALPLSADYTVCTKDNIENAMDVLYNKEVISFNVMGNQYNYDIANNALIENIDIISLTDDKMIICEDWIAYDYDISTGNKTSLDIPISRGASHFCLSNDKTRAYDKNYNALEHDLSTYNIVKDDIKGGNEDVIVFNADNEKKERYTIVLNKDGSYVCEPYEHTDVKEIAYHANVSDSKVILFGYKDRIIDRNTGEVTTYDSNFEILNYDDINDLMLVNTNGAYYLVDPEAPDVLINPFERANG